MAFYAEVVMGVSQAAIFVFTFLVIFILVVLLKTGSRNNDIVAYSIGYSEFEVEGEDEHHDFSGLLHVSQLVKRAETDGNLTTVSKVDCHDKD